MWKIAILVLTTVWSIHGQQKFHGHKMLGMFASDKEELKLLQTLSESRSVDFWNDPVALYEKVNVRVPPEIADDIESELRANGIDFYIITENLQEWIDTERDENPPDDEWAGRQTNFQLDVYHTFEAISSYMDTAASRYSSIASIKTYGTTFEGNPIRGLKIGTPGQNKSAIWVDAGIHAREWVSPATAIYFVEQLLTGYDTDPEMKRYVDTYDWYILPVANPDGYKFTWTSNRMWRKNRARNPYNPFCRGADPNRNFDSAFGGPGTSNDGCSEIYRGHQAFSEAESSAVRDGIASIGHENVKAFFSMHAYSQLWMTPYGHSRTNPPHYTDQVRALQAASAAIQNKHGQYYRHGTIANTIYPAAGSSVDWAYEKANIKYSFAIELRDTGRQGFLLSNQYIIPTAEENWEGVKAVISIIDREQGVNRFSVKTRA